RERLYVHKDGHQVAALVGAAVLEGTAECIAYVTDISDRKQTEEALRASESQYRALFNSSPLPKWVYDVETLHFLAVNDTALKHYGYSREEFLRMTIADVCPGEGDAPGAAPGRGAGDWPDGVSFRRHRKKDGSYIEAEETVHPFLFGDRPSRLVVAQNVTERRLQEEARRGAEEALRRSEERLRQSQKMEALGSLAGGVAHDFNNLLSVILSYSEMLARDLKPGDPMRLDLDEINGAGNRAAELTRQLLAFSRQQILQPRILNPNDVIAGIEKLLARLIGEDVELKFIGDPTVGRVNADPGQLEQILMNLVVNARDAMPKGGKLTIETCNVELDSGYAADHVSVTPGAYVMVAVTDTGCGMYAEQRARIFDPFYTTKEKGKGTGLGLSTVFGIVRQSGGHIWVYSEPGAGSTFKIYLPRADAGSVSVTNSTIPPETLTPRGAETVLLVEDEKHVRALAQAILRQYGYHVLEAHSGGDALVISEQHPATIHLLLTDVVMPRMSGRELAERLCVQRPAMKVLFMSGYSDASIVHHGILDSDIDFIHKPITPDALARKVREVLDASRSQDPRAQGGPDAASGTFGVMDSPLHRRAGRS
ncbi:MAG: ATP-binding protein, partial [Myxococcota bacterium]|nr:ATP-binding protein [Myxococcota bacterium]